MMGINAVFKALADPTRREILRLLSGGERTAGELASSFDMTKPSMSHHFAVLKEADLILMGFHKPVFGQATAEPDDRPLQQHVRDRHPRCCLANGREQGVGQRGGQRRRRGLGDRVEQVGEAGQRGLRPRYARRAQHGAGRGLRPLRGDGSPQARLADARRPHDDHRRRALLVPRERVPAGSQFPNPANQVHSPRIGAG